MSDILAAAIVDSAIGRLHKSIVEFNASNAKQSRRMLQLTAVMTAAVGVQIYLALTVTS